MAPTRKSDTFGLMKQLSERFAGWVRPGGEQGGLLDLPVGALLSDGVIGCRAGDPLTVAARLMAEHRIHALAVEPDDGWRQGDRGGFAVLSDADLMEALAGGGQPDEVAVGEIAATEPVTVDVEASVGEAARLMSEHEVSHLFVTGSEGGRPRGVVSTLDLARSLHARPRQSVGLRALVAHDAGPGGADAAALARVLAGRDGLIEAVLVVPFPPGVVGEPPIEVPGEAPSWSELCDSLTEAGADAISERILPQLPGGSSGFAVLDDSPARALSVVSDRHHPDLVTLGSSRRGRIGRVLLGSTAESLTHGSSVPVAVAPRGYADAAPRRIEALAVGFDGREESGRALEVAADLALRHEALLRVVAVVEPSVGTVDVVGEAWGALSGEGLGGRTGRLREAAQTALAEREARGLEVEVEVRQGGAAGELLAACERGIDLLVLGSRGYGPLSRVLLGSVSSRVTSEAPCPVLIAARGRWERRERSS